MEKVLFFTIIAFGLSANSKPPERKYFFVDELKNWTEAQSYCRQTYTDLATIENEEDVKTLNDMAASMGKTYRAWIGLYDDVNSWRWSMSDSNFYQNQKEFRRWKKGQPDNYGGQEKCGAMNFDGSWSDASCSTTYNSICLQISGSNAAFVHTETNLNWTEAQSYCRKHHTDLASVRNLAENQQVNNVIPKGLVWIGIFRDSWKWVDASNSSFRYWDVGNNEPNNNGKEECVAAHFGRSGRWEDRNCDEKKTFICYCVLCGNGTHPARKYYFVGELKNWTEAQSHCRDYYSNLAVIENMEDVGTLNNMAASLNHTSAAWIGLYNDVNSWRWSVSGLKQKEENNFTNWNSLEPNNHAGKESCVLVGSTGFWNDDVCSKMKHSICSDVTGSDVTFVYININMSWTDAQSYCRDHHTDLARVRDMTDNQKIKTLIPAGGSAWIGLYRPFWMWADGSKSTFRHWASSQPNGAEANCAFTDLLGGNLWWDKNCGEQWDFACYKVVCGKSTLPTREFVIIVEPRKNWTEARRYCREHYTDLATINNMEDLTTLYNLKTSQTGTQPVWIGLYEDVNSWRWSMSDDVYQREKNQFRNWAAGEPNNEFGKESCGALKTDGSWYDVPCSQTMKTVCFKVSGNITTFYYNRVKRTWTEAQSYCRERYTDLVTVRHMSDNQVIKDLVSKPVWIGLYRDSWKWVDGKNSSYRYWNSVEPNNNGTEGCAAANFGNAGKWEDWSCKEKKAFVCYLAESKHLIKLKLVLPSSLLRDNSAVLEKLKQKLEQDGVKGDIKLSWRKQSDGKIFQKEKKKKDEL